jgi:hypothetical protein
MNDGKKTVQIYFYSMDIERKKKSADDTPYSIDAICKALSSLFTNIVSKDLKAKTKDMAKKKKVVWLEEVSDLDNGNFNIVFKSARYDQSREVINTDTMEQRGVLKQPEDGDEEKTHLCVRLRKGADRLTAVLESNYLGISTSDIAAYLNEQFNFVLEDSEEQYSYKVSFEIMPSEDFLVELANMKKVNLLRITVDLKDLGLGDFQSLADKDILRPTVELYIRKERGKDSREIKDIINATYNDHKSANPQKQIRKISVEGSNKSGNLKIDTESIHMKHSMEVETESSQLQNVVKTSDFFNKAWLFIIEKGV